MLPDTPGASFFHAPCQIPNQALRVGSVIQLPGLAQCPADAGNVLLWAALGDVARLVNLAALNQRVATERVRAPPSRAPWLHRGIYRRGTFGSSPRSMRLSSKSLDRRGVLGGALDQPENVLVAVTVDADGRLSARYPRPRAGRRSE